MKILVIGADGFIGGALIHALRPDHDVYEAARSIKADIPLKRYNLDLLDTHSVANILRTVEPEVIVNCAGIVSQGPESRLNTIFTRNLLHVISDLGITLKRLVIVGSAAEYGLFVKKNPVPETAALAADSPYGKSKVEETQYATRYGQEHGVPVVIARIFNPIGTGMNPRLLLPSIIRQLSEITTGKRANIMVSRLDASRDYLDVRDVALGIKAIIEGSPSYDTYNIGSGKSTSNAELIEKIVKYSGVRMPEIKETSEGSDPPVASGADISRLKRDLGWEPKYSLDDAIRGVIHHEQQKN